MLERDGAITYVGSARRSRLYAALDIIQAEQAILDAYLPCHNADGSVANLWEVAQGRFFCALQPARCLHLLEISPHIADVSSRNVSVGLCEQAFKMLFGGASAKSVGNLRASRRELINAIFGDDGGVASCRNLASECGCIFAIVDRHA